ncbi:hypothetical protein GSY74_05885 [Sulfurovum sp. bin170]|uniref:hypothetical protein n=1 Tax=Sulfurovum sp. bin170 TaxID=2695268 RepID=UPI0013E06EE0|nr:hypothetical protein [Sulfurovum sp. bin170]NEW60807.1 hypothetical protein [Sulfurovum sp. bin170]
MSQRLIDQAIENPIKNPFRIGWEFFKLNRGLAFAIIGVHFLLSILGLIPAIGILFSIASGIFVMAVQIYVGKLFYQAEGMSEFAKAVEESSLQNIIDTETKTAIGAYMGWILFAIVVGFTVALSLGANMQEMAHATSTAKDIEIPLTPILVLLGLLVLSYVFPIVQANVILAENFKEGFFAVMRMFSANYWRKAMTGGYFKYISLFSLVLLGFMLLLGLLLSIMLSISPLFYLLIMVLMIPIMMIFTVIMGLSALIANDIAEPKA